MLSVIGVSTSGWLTDRAGPRQAATVSFVGTGLGIGFLYSLSFSTTLFQLLGYVVLFGLCQGARGPVVAALSARYYAGPGQATVYGLIYALMSVGTGLGALLSGFLHDLTDGYGAGFAAALVSVMFAAAPFWLSDDLSPSTNN